MKREKRTYSHTLDTSKSRTIQAYMNFMKVLLKLSTKFFNKILIVRKFHENMHL